MKKRGFSLVEILVALIIVSVIMAALAPVITKKLSSAGITIVGGGSGGGGGAVDGDISKSICKDGTYWDEGFQGCKICSHKTPHCESCNTNTGVCSVCADGYELDENNKCEIEGETSCGDFAIKIMLNGVEYCMLKYNAGDKNELPLSRKVTEVTPGSKCSPSSSSFCCWRGGRTANSYSTNVNGSYAANNRTVCDWRGAVETCRALTYQGLPWRLPTTGEMAYLASSIGTYSLSQGDSGLMLCSYSAVATSDQCSSHSNCQGATENYCRAWRIQTTNQDHTYGLDGSSFAQDEGSTGRAASVRCVSPLIKCASGFYSNIDDMICSSCESKTPNCQTCNKKTGVCSGCKDGYYLDKYNMCRKDDDPCGEYAMKVTLNGIDYCMTKYNIGDAPGDKLPISSKVTVVTPGSTCSPSTSNFCCWKGGITAATYINLNQSTYNGNNTSLCDINSGCYDAKTRTACDWRASNYNCQDLKYQGLTWRLPTTAEMNALSTEIDRYSVGKEEKGLMLCAYDAVFSREKGLTSVCSSQTTCNGASNENYCRTWRITTNNSGYAYGLEAGTFKQITENVSIGTAKSNRCVAPLIECEDGKYGDVDTFECKSCSEKTANCKKCNKRTGTCTECETGYKLNEYNECKASSDPCGDLALKIRINNQDYCMLKYNIGDKDQLPIPQRITTVTAGTTCSPSVSNFCCWKGNTSADYTNINGGYSGQARTVCDYRAATEACKYLKYQDMHWRLPTVNELTSFKSYLDVYSRGKGSAGLMLCDYAEGYTAAGSSDQCATHSNCPGASDNKYCRAWRIWTSTSAKAFGLETNSFNGPVETGTGYAASIRCIAPIVDCAEGYYSDIDTFECNSCSIKTANCAKCHKRNGTCEECRDGYHLDKYNQCVADDDPCGDLAMKVTLNGQDYCMTKYNIGDFDESRLTIPNTVKIVTPGTTCSPSATNFCCWRGGITAETYTNLNQINYNASQKTTCDISRGCYNAQTRTVCDWRAANEICSKLKYQDLLWRLPSTAELSALSSLLNKYTMGKQDAGLMLCDYTASYSPVNGYSSQCQTYANCQGASDSNYCRSWRLWSSTSGQLFGLDSNTLSGPQTVSVGTANSVRCVAPFVNCSAGKYNESGVCTDCDKKVANCTDCNKYTGECLACREGFELKNGACMSSACGALAMQVKLGGKDMCMTKYNLGPDALQAGMANYGAGSFSLPTTVKKAIAGSSTCDSLNEKCCWVGVTATNCDKANGRYSGCSRTVCNWAGAKEACSKLNYLGKTWRLLTSSELDDLSGKVDTLSKNLGDNGLMLCHQSTALNSGHAICSGQERCAGASGNLCHPDNIWTGTTSSETRSYYGSFDEGALESSGKTFGTNAAFSFRCVADL